MIVSERSSVHLEHTSIFNRFKRFAHIFADHVVANSFAQFDYLSTIPFLSGKSQCIYNGYDISSFDFASPSYWDSPSELTLLVIGRIDQNKNGVNILKALILFYQKYGECPRLRWVGRQPNDPHALNERFNMNQLLHQHPEVSANCFFLDEVSNIPALLSESHALVHVSYFEGLSNAVCEALVSGRPVIASSISDQPLLAKDGVRGFICDPSAPFSICTAIERLYALSKPAYLNLCRSSRTYAVSHLSLAKMVDTYENLLK